MSVVISGTDGITLPDDGSLSTSIGEAISITSGYVSGIQLGGTAAANTLDSYEEGTWTPTFSNVNYAYGTYTKVGRSVTCNMLVSVNSSGASGFGFDGLPFATNSTSGHRGGGVVTFQNTSAEIWSVLLDSANTGFTFRHGSDVREIAISRIVYATFTYITDS
jgi:hypothetical protein